MWRKCKGGEYTGTDLILAFWAIVIVGLLLALLIYLIKVYPVVAFICLFAFIIGAAVCFARTAWSKKKRIISGIICIIFATAFCLCGVFAIVKQNEAQAALCHASKCDYKHEEGSLYCYYHTCRLTGCNNYKTKSATYCYTHSSEDLSTSTIKISKESVSTEQFYSSTRYVFRCTVTMPDSMNLCYAVLTLYNDNDEAIYSDSVQVALFNDTIRFKSVCVYVNKKDASTYTSYKWTAVRKNPND